MTGRRASRLTVSVACLVVEDSVGGPVGRRSTPEHSGEVCVAWTLRGEEQTWHGNRQRYCVKTWLSKLGLTQRFIPRVNTKIKYSLLILHVHSTDRPATARSIEHEEVGHRRFSCSQCFQNILSQHPTNHGTHWRKFMRCRCRQRSAKSLSAQQCSDIYRATHSIRSRGMVSSTCLFTSDVSNNELAIDRSCGASSKLSGSFPAWVCWYSQMASSPVTHQHSGMGTISNSPHLVPHVPQPD